MNRAFRLMALLVAALLATTLSAAFGQNEESAAPSDTTIAADRQPHVPAGPGAGAGTRTSEELEKQSQEKENWYRHVFGPFMWPLWACSIALVALIGERRKALRMEQILEPQMVERVIEMVGELRVADAQASAERSQTLVGRAWARALHEFSLGGVALADALTNSTLLALKPLKRRLPGIATIAVISPLLGLLGTVLGMIMTFGQIAAAGGADKARLAGGIGVALFTTAGGLIIAIPAILANRYFLGRIGNIAEQLEEAIGRANYRHSHALFRAQQDGKTATPPAEPTEAQGGQPCEA